jgi:hypothetical protein
MKLVSSRVVAHRNAPSVADPGRAGRAGELRRQLAKLDRAVLTAEPLADPTTKEARRAYLPPAPISRFARADWPWQPRVSKSGMVNV